MIPAKSMEEKQDQNHNIFQEGNSTFTSNLFLEEEPVQIIMQQKNDLIAFLSENNSLFELDLEKDPEFE